MQPRTCVAGMLKPRKERRGSDRKVGRIYPLLAKSSTAAVKDKATVGFDF